MKKTKTFPNNSDFDEDRAFRDFIEKSEKSKRETFSNFNPSGEWFLTKTLYDGKRRNDEQGVHASIHEFFHESIDYGSRYGNLLLAFKILHTADHTSEYYFSILEYLKSNSERSHETFATWSSIARFLYSNSNYTLEQFSNGNAQYEAYYKSANDWLLEVDTFNCKNAIFTSCILFCFSSNNIGLKVFADLSKLDFTDVTPFDYPDKRFEIIKENFSASDIKEAFLKYTSSQDISLKHRDIVKNILAGIEVEAIDNLEFYLGLGSHFYELFRVHFNLIGSTSLDYSPLTTIPRELLLQIKELTGIEVQTRDLDLHDIEHAIIMGMESEIVLLNDEKEKCRVIFLNDLDPSLKGEIFKGKNEPNIFQQNSHLTIMMRHPKFLLEQFSFLNNDERIWLESCEYPITYLATYIYENGIRVILLVIIKDVDNFSQLFSEESKLPLCLCIFTHVLGESDFLQRWEPIIRGNFLKLFYYNDLPLLFLLKHNFFSPQHPEIYYCELDVTLNGDTSSNAIIYCIKNEDAIECLYITPMSKYQSYLYSRYISKNYDRHIAQEGFLDRDQNAQAILDILKQVHYEHSLISKQFLINE